MKKNMIAMAGLLVLVAAVRADLCWGQIGFGPGQSMDPTEVLQEGFQKMKQVVLNDALMRQAGARAAKDTDRSIQSYTDGDWDFARHAHAAMNSRRSALQPHATIAGLNWDG
jgi:hypothetical protein